MYCIIFIHKITIITVRLQSTQRDFKLSKVNLEIECQHPYSSLQCHAGYAEQQHCKELRTPIYC